MYTIYLYGHGSSSNHGCEAIVKSTINLLKNTGLDIRFVLISNNPESDIKWGMKKYVEQIYQMPTASFVPRVAAKFCHILHIKNNFINDSIALNASKLIKNADLAISIGGDNYCYSKQFNHLFYKLNKLLKRSNIKTILWGCSISSELIDKEMIADLKSYNLITVRETLTLNNLKNKGISSNVRLFPDSAFTLENIESGVELPVNTVGINISPMIIEYEKNNNMVLKNYQNLIYYILNNTNYNIAFIPHVTIDGGNDIVIIDKLLNSLNNIDENRIINVSELDACKIKNVISKCKIFVGARTHSTIAAYSSKVPTLVVGYSVKAKGIAKDLFGKFENYVLPVQNLDSDEALCNSFKWLDDNYDMIKSNLESVIPEYSKKTYDSIEIIKSILEEK